MGELPGLGWAAEFVPTALLFLWLRKRCAKRTPQEIGCICRLHTAGCVLRSILPKKGRAADAGAPPRRAGAAAKK